MQGGVVDARYRGAQQFVICDIQHKKRRVFRTTGRHAIGQILAIPGRLEVVDGVRNAGALGLSLRIDKNCFYARQTAAHVKLVLALARLALEVKVAVSRHAGDTAERISPAVSELRQARGQSVASFDAVEYGP